MAAGAGTGGEGELGAAAAAGIGQARGSTRLIEGHNGLGGGRQEVEEGGQASERKESSFERTVGAAGKAVVAGKTAFAFAVAVAVAVAAATASSSFPPSSQKSPWADWVAPSPQGSRN